MHERQAVSPSLQQEATFEEGANWLSVGELRALSRVWRHVTENDGRGYRPVPGLSFKMQPYNQTTMFILDNSAKTGIAFKDKVHGLIILSFCRIVAWQLRYG